MKKSDRPTARRLLGSLIIVAAAGLIWLAFRFVVSDAILFLEYIRVLVWPVVVVAALSFFRHPVEEKVRQLLRLDAFGASAEFSPEAQGRRLEHDLNPELQGLLDSFKPNEAETVDSNAASRDQLEDDRDLDQDTSDGPLGAPTPTSGRPLESTPLPTDEGADVQDLASNVVPLDDVLSVARALAMPLGERHELRERALRGDRNALGDLTGRMIAAAQRAQSARNLSVHRQGETRERIEAVIRTSAAWGYGMGRAGAPETVPDIEWNDDGTWRITTDIPQTKVTSKQNPVSRPDAVNHDREIRELVKEIKEIERRRHGAFGVSAGLMAAQDRGWLDELKRRLALVDPGNPWTR